MYSKPLSLTLAALCTLTAVSSATIVINISAANIANESGVSAQAGTLFQLVNLGANGAFDPIDVSDATNTGLGRWVSGDDSVLNISFLNPSGQLPGDFASTKAFDLQFNPGAEADSTPGFLARSFQFAFADLPVGTKLGIRWFTGLLAKDFDTITLATGQKFGQFTRQNPDPITSGAYWVGPGDGASVTFQGFSTQSFGGQAPNSMGFASETVIPEPAAIGLSLLGAAGLSMLRRRRA